MERARSEIVAGCTGCMACRLVCSFRLAGCYRPAVSAIQVRRSYTPVGVSFSLRVDPTTCDRCREEAAALCERACAPGVLTLGLVDRLRGAQ